MAIKIYADGADLRKMDELSSDPRIAGFTTNPTLARAAGVSDYRKFCLLALEAARGKPVSLEVLADDPENMLRQANILARLGSNAVVKVPVTNSLGQSTAAVIRELARDEITLNITAVFTTHQVEDIGEALAWRGRGTSIVSVFAGRIADAGTNPLRHMDLCRRILSRACVHAQMLWASPRQLYDLTLAEVAGCEIITMTPDLIAKLPLRGKDLAEYSRETSAMFHRDAMEAGFVL